MIDIPYSGGYFKKLNYMWPLYFMDWNNMDVDIMWGGWLIIGIKF